MCVCVSLFADFCCCCVWISLLSSFTFAFIARFDGGGGLTFIWCGCVRVVSAHFNLIFTDRSAIAQHCLQTMHWFSSSFNRAKEPTSNLIAMQQFIALKFCFTERNTKRQCGLFAALFTTIFVFLYFSPFEMKPLGNSFFLLLLFLQINFYSFCAIVWNCWFATFILFYQRDFFIHSLLRI